LTTHGNLWPPGGTIRTGVPVCVELSRPTCDWPAQGTRSIVVAQGQGQPASSGWPGPQGHGDSIGMAGQRAARRGATRADGELRRRQARANGTSATGILTRRAETSEAQALFMSSPAVAQQTPTPQPRKNQRGRTQNFPRTKDHGALTHAPGPRTVRQQTHVHGPSTSRG
jgi:hypothetical protein